MTTRPSLFIAGGTLPSESPLYVERDVDKELHEALLQGEYCYLLTPRQMGKSSLIAHLRDKLKHEQFFVGVLDLQRVGKLTTPEQWYFNLAYHLCSDMGLAKYALLFLHQPNPPQSLQMWVRLFDEVILPHCPGRVVIFIDELDLIRGMPFETDEFFASIRACYNARATQPDYQRLTFCLVGSALPTDLIRDARNTPFNIGRRFDLMDFTLSELSPFETALGRDSRTNRLLLKRILDWTSGHPYLTQRLCKEVAEDQSALTRAKVDEHCRRHLLNFGTASHKDRNLVDTQLRLLLVASNGESPQQVEERRAGMLTLYRTILQGGKQYDDETYPWVGLLKLSGVVCSKDGLLHVRNRIYRRVFDQRWIETHLSDAERIRQGQAFRKGVLRTAAIASVPLLVIVALFFFALYQWSDAHYQSNEVNQKNLSLTETQKKLQEALEGKRVALYTSDMFVANRQWEEGNLQGGEHQLEIHTPPARKSDLRGWEWRYLWGLTHWQKFTLSGHQHIVYCLAYSPNGKWVATGGFDKTICLWDAKTGILSRKIHGHKGWIASLAFSPQSDMLVSGSRDRAIGFWNPITGQQIRQPITSKIWVNHLEFLSSNMLVSGNGEVVQTTDLVNGRTLQRTSGKWVTNDATFAFSPKKQMLAVVHKNTQIEFWETKTWHKLSERKVTIPQEEVVVTIKFSPHGKLFAAGTASGKLYIWSFANWQHPKKFEEGKNDLHGIDFSSDDTYCVTTSWDTKVRICNLKTGQLYEVLGHQGRVNAIAFAPDNKTFTTVSSDKTAKVWDWEAILTKRRERYSLNNDWDAVPLFAANANRVIGTIKGKLRCWDITKRNEIPISLTLLPQEKLLAVSADGNRIATLRNKKTIIVWDLKTKRESRRFTTHEWREGEMALDSQGERMGAISQTSEIINAEANNRTENYICTIKTGEKSALVTDQVQSALSALFSSDNRYLAISWEGADTSNCVTVYDALSHRIIFTTPKLGNVIKSMAFSADSTLLAVSDWSGPITVLNVLSQKKVGELRVPAEYASGTTFSPDDKTFATIENNQIVRLWNVATWREVGRFCIPDTTKEAKIFFSTDRRFLVVPHSKGVYWWEAPL